MSSLSHPNIVQYMFCERDDNCISIFMELCKGGSLSTMINKRELRDAEEVRRILADIVNAVAYLHKKRIVHRDLKPDNVLFRDGHAKLTDFGTAVHKKREDLNLVKGTLAYMAPEILVGDPYGKACDVWSIGCIAADILYVDLPQRSLSLAEMCDFYRKMGSDAPLEFNCDVSQVKNFLSSCLQRNPKERLTATQLLNHEMLQPQNSALNRWMVTVEAKWKAADAEMGKKNSDLNSDSLNSNSFN
ncbi:hypothetical protein STCU_11976 [Strigomonas culicis]|uniref:Protein kinase domain-containing protein n=1 Tax=Strigomonas culicis TaxID=28005 RepID=S9TBW4_9TRYP|nr:hypothetical protein STCU_11976 [Strigomonas culicis]|eukprot:EPY15497.1 hypothetical protein STCU_11976 [Strigomonas culicis]